MRNEGATGRGRAPARVLLRGEPDGWHWVLVDDAGAERRSDFAGAGTRWSAGGRSDPEPAWWRRRLAETADGLREAVAERLTDATFREFGTEAAITWFAVAEPVEWEGIVTLREADPARFPGRVPPFVVTLEPGRGALLPDASLLFSTRAADAWTTLAAVAERCGTLLRSRRSCAGGPGTAASGWGAGRWRCPPAGATTASSGSRRSAGRGRPAGAATPRCGSGSTASTCSTSPPATSSRCFRSSATRSSRAAAPSGWRPPGSPSTRPTGPARRSGSPVCPSGCRPPCRRSGPVPDAR
ncbi:hypothetical protein ACFQY7_55295 [Actinomadura luteofluorescens]|uniref:hypothetical protein n=1 Tax=Actinomadura luteofluorescens TaxID=46163 RepID=UPI0036336007